eukprot:gb/GFBE01011253.1/.p1 GENE.gb/GFBE01011253.1/~~gb/GFBE01011253.1/.p1  ORF type:complete len:299 (+),score=53.66 gb/GFBE01011253.1/:1-897(+)
MPGQAVRTSPQAKTKISAPSAANDDSSGLGGFFGSLFGGAAAEPLPGVNPGDACFYKSAAHGWIPAAVKQFHPSRGCYDLDVKQSVAPESIFSLQPGASVEYHSVSANRWIPAKVVRARPDETFDLDVKEQVPIVKIWPAPSQGKLGQLRKSVNAMDSVVLRQRLESQSQLPLPPEFLQDSQSLALSELRKAMKGRDQAVLGAAIEKAALAGVSEEELENATQALQDLEEPMWRYDPEDHVHLDIRSAPVVSGPRTKEALLAGEVFRVSKEQRGADGVNYLKLADGRGWVFEKKHGVG